MAPEDCALDQTERSWITSSSISHALWMNRAMGSEPLRSSQSSGVWLKTSSRRCACAAAGDDEAGDRAAALEAQAIQDIERRKDTERRELLDRVRTIVTAIAAERQVSLVLRADQVLAFSPESEITDEVLGRLDRL